MSELSIWVGETKIIPVDKIRESDNLSENFKTCRYRSEEKRTKTRKLCCGSSSSISGYTCSKRGIFNIQSEVCNICPVYDPKKT